MTTYDQIWQTFLNNCKVPENILPSGTSKIYESICNGISLLNNRLRTDFTCDNVAETVHPKLDHDHLLIAAYLIRLVLLENERIFQSSLWQPFAKDITIRNFSAQLKSLDTSIEATNNKIDELIRNMEVDFL